MYIDIISIFIVVFRIDLCLLRNDSDLCFLVFKLMSRRNTFQLYGRLSSNVLISLLDCFLSLANHIFILSFVEDALDEDLESSFELIVIDSIVLVLVELLHCLHSCLHRVWHAP